jgi:hypothetical protein
VTFKESILQDFWFHLGGLIAIGIGVFAWYQHNHMASDPSAVEIGLVLGGIAAMGVKILNGSTTLLRTAIGVAKAAPIVIPPDKAA